MQKGLAASPSWPMGTKGYVVYQGKKAEFFIGDRGPGIPSNKGVMLDLDGKTFAYLTGGTWDRSSLTVHGTDLGHIGVTYVVTQWGEGPGKKGAPLPFSSGAYSKVDHSPATATCPASTSSGTAPAGLGTFSVPAFSGVLAAGPHSGQAIPAADVSAVLLGCALAMTAGNVFRRTVFGRAADRLRGR
ncbi:hypothetical protein Pth03_50530 [Planotetraspora thailandica]|uniref:Uncharacterized protein n=1 Tax=Planotetraspora thailandica TaxID=487172 RepID=A0A8J3V2R7_9ACTN|nr:hypothetical protein [Planotetraspora thailandica]GII56664.1 hypothetical protein Pth03_50530 [Planotetraspora thailandica]